jgi:hypothetical protein
MISTVFCDFSILSLNTDVNEPTVRNKYKNVEKHSYFVGILKATAKKGRIRIHYLVFGTKDLYPYQTLPDPEHCLKQKPTQLTRTLVLTKTSKSVIVLRKINQ